MNLVGKIFTVLIFVMCIVFASFALMLHAGHKNWYNEIARQGGYRDQVDKLAKEKSDLQQAYALLEDQRKKDNLRNEKLIGDLRVANEQLSQSERAASEKNLVMEGNLRKFATDFKLVEQNLTDLRDEAETLRKENKDAVAQQQTMWDKLVAATTGVNNAGAEITRLQKQLRDVAEQYVAAQQILARGHIRPSDVLANPPAGLRGLVTAVQQSDVAISLGYDSGVANGQRFAVTRPSTGRYIGEIVVYKVPYPNGAICRADKSTMTDQIQKGDDVQASLSKHR